MKNKLSPRAALAALVLLTSGALADDRTDCLGGIEMIKAEIAKNHPAPVLDKLREALKKAEQEADYADWDECVDAVNEARRAR